MIISENVKIRSVEIIFSERARFWPKIEGGWFYSYSTPQLSTRSYRPSGYNIRLLLQRHIYTYNLY